MTLDIKQLGKGALRDVPDKRNLKLSFLAGAAMPVVWSREFRLPEPPDTNQENADNCVGEGWSHFHWQLKGKRFSVRSIFAYIAQAYGAYGKDGGMRIVNYGQETFDEAPDPAHKTPQNMRSKAGLKPALALDDRELRIFETNGRSIEQVAQAIRDWRGAAFGLELSPQGWQDYTNPRPPKAGEDGTGHYLYGMGFHTHSDGQKCIIAKSNWCGAQPGHHEHHIREEYFKSASMHALAFVLVPKENIPMVRRFKVDDHGKLGVMLVTDGAFDAPVFWAKNEAMYERLLNDYEVPADAPVITLP